MNKKTLTDMKILKPTTLLCIAIFGLFLTSTAHPVDQQTAKTIAEKFMQTNDLQLLTTYRTENDIAAFYVFNTTNGFVIVSANDCETPIIGYSREGRFDPNNVPVQMEDYLQDFVARIQYGIENHLETDELTAKQWELVKTNGRLNDRKNAKSVEPLLTEKWHQGCLYNSLCPEMSGPCGHAEVGCVAVAMGQIMHYWGYPASGWGTHSYYNQGVVLSADFGSTTYDWEHMPDSLTESSSDTEIEAVATLLYQSGVSVNMDYTSNGSNANSANVTNALTRYFSYSRQLHRDKKGNNNDAWLAKLKDCLDLQRPIYYSGQGSAGGHAFVCDGYDDNDLLHFNWGWGGNGDGYFALGNLNPIGYSFNNNNYAIFDIIPEYEPCVVAATAYPSTAGTIEGTGEYHIGDSCTLTAIPAEGYQFYCWKRNEKIISNMPSITLTVEEDILDIEAHFSCFPVSQITASYSPEASNPNSPSVSLSWSHPDIEWIPIKQFDIQGENSVATDGEYIYTCYATDWSNPMAFGKYTMDGDLEEHFNVKDEFYAFAMTTDGDYFYCGNNMAWLEDSRILYCIDFANKRIIDSINTGMEFECCTYDSENDGFWLSIFNLSSYKSELTLVNRQGQRIAKSPKTNNSIRGTGYIIAKDGSPHLLVLMEGGVVYDFDITNNRFSDNPLLVFDDGFVFGCSIGKYDGKDALFTVIDSTVRIYEIKNTLSQIVGYRIYRKDSEEHIVTLANEFIGSSYIDSTWNEAIAGEYRFGISEVYANGVESEILWSDSIVKTDFGIDENGNREGSDPSVQKVIEDGQIVIIKDGKRYNVTGQHLN